MKILLTGCTGQVGHALQQQLRQYPQHQLITVTRQQMDLTQPDSIRSCIRKHQPDLLINPAAYTAVDLAEDEVELAHQINAIAPAVMAEEMKAINAGLLHFSTDYVFDGTKASAYTETDTTAPLSVYGHSKLAGEQAIQTIAGKHLIFRTSWVYSDFGKNFLLTMLRLAERRDELSIVNDQWGAPTSALWIADTIAKIIQLINTTLDKNSWWEANSGVINLTSTNVTNWLGFAQEIFDTAEQLKLLNKIKPVLHGINASEYPAKARRPSNSSLSTQRLNKRFEIIAPTWQDNLKVCLKQIATNKSTQSN